MAAENAPSDIITLAGMFRDVTVEMMRLFGNDPVGLLIWCSTWVIVAVLFFLRGPTRQIANQLQAEVKTIKTEIHEIKSSQLELNDVVVDYQKERMAMLSDIQNNLRHINERIDKTYNNFADKDRILGLERSMAHFTEETATVIAQMRAMTGDSSLVKFVDSKKDSCRTDADD